MEVHTNQIINMENRINKKYTPIDFIFRNSINTKYSIYDYQDNVYPCGYC